MGRRLRKFGQILQKAEWRRGLLYGVAASVEHSAFLASNPVATLLDAGANKGQFSLALRGFWPNTRIVAFEPQPLPADRFARLFARDSKISLERIALGRTRQGAQMHVSRKSACSSLLPLGVLQEEVFPGTSEVGTQAVSVVPLDDAVDVASLPRPILLKIDVQGLELDVLRGGEKSLASIERLYIEVSFVPLYVGQAIAHEIVAWLAERGFLLAGIYHIELDRRGRAVQADMHFHRDPSL